MQSCMTSTQYMCAFQVVLKLWGALIGIASNCEIQRSEVYILVRDLDISIMLHINAYNCIKGDD